MQTTYELALNEFREASAIVRRAFGAVSEARELQIIADSQHRDACNAHADAVSRLERADASLQAAREAPATAAAITSQSAIAFDKATGQGALAAHPAPVFASFREPDPQATEADHRTNAPGPFDAPRPNGSIDAEAAGIGIS